MSILLDGTGGVTTPGVVNTAGETIATTLSVTGATNLSALTTTGNTILGDASTDTLNVGNGGLVKDASGNVGIGTATPVTKLTVSGTTTINTATDATAGLTVRTFGTGAARQPIANFERSDSLISTQVGFNGANGDSYIGTTTNHNLYFITADTERMRLTNTGLLQFNSGYGSVATAYGCRAWVNFNGTGTVSIRASGNVSSITDNGTGDYTVNFTTAMSDANYSLSAWADTVNGTGTQINTVGGVRVSSGSYFTTSSMRIGVNEGATTRVDSQSITVSIFR